MHCCKLLLNYRIHPITYRNLSTTLWQESSSFCINTSAPLRDCSRLERSFEKEVHWVNLKWNYTKKIIILIIIQMIFISSNMLPTTYQKQVSSMGNTSPMKHRCYTPIQSIIFSATAMFHVSSTFLVRHSLSLAINSTFFLFTSTNNSPLPHPMPPLLEKTWRGANRSEIQQVFDGSANWSIGNITTVIPSSLQ